MKKYKVELTRDQWLVLGASLEAHKLSKEDDSKFAVLYNTSKNTMVSLLPDDDNFDLIIEIGSDDIQIFLIAMLRASIAGVFNLEEKILVGQALNYLDKLIG